MNSISDTIDAIMRDLTRGMTRQTVIDYHTSSRPDADKVKTIVSDVERGIPQAIAIAYHTSGGAPQATQARTVQQTVDPPRRAAPHPNSIEGMPLKRLLYRLRRLAARYNYTCIAECIRYLPSETVSGLVETITVPTVRSWCLGDFNPEGYSVSALRRFLIAHRDDRASLDLRPAGLRFPQREG